MTKMKILEEIKKLTPSERIVFIEATLKMTREDLRVYNKIEKQPQSKVERKRNLQTAAKALLSDYSTDREFTIFTTLDGEDFHV
jgi:hypothetical protein